MLNKAGEEKWEDWPSPWRGRERMSFSQVVAFLNRLVHLLKDPSAAKLPPFDSEHKRNELRDLMSGPPGVVRPGFLGELRSLWAESQKAGAKYGSGFLIERRNFPSEWCRWKGCGRPLYSPQEPRGKGRPLRYCPGHQKHAKSRTQRLRRKGIFIGIHRNWTYRPPEMPPDIAIWKKAPKIGGKSTDQFQQSREVWEGIILSQER